nr:unnamed protein product [Callosobruchus analis]
MSNSGEGNTNSSKTPSDAVGSLPSSTLGTNNAQNLAQSTEMPHNTFTHFSKSYLVILSTAIVQITDATGAYHQCRALLDSGSQSHFITIGLANLLNKVNSIDMSVTGINNAKSNVSTYTSVHIRSLHNHFEVDINCLVISEITGPMPSISFDKCALVIPTELNLNDPDYNISNKIDLLIGADLFWTLLKTGQVNLGKRQPILQNTLLGWIISGEISNSLLTGTNDLQLLLQLYKDIRHILESCGFTLNKWISNNPDIIEHIKSDNPEVVVNIGKNGETHSLGLLWSSSQDCLQYEVEPKSSSKSVTKRTVISTIARIIDPLGILGPVVVKAKIILQDIWKIGLGGDESLPLKMHTEWQLFYSI